VITCNACDQLSEACWAGARKGERNKKMGRSPHEKTGPKRKQKGAEREEGDRAR